MTNKLKCLLLKFLSSEMDGDYMARKRYMYLLERIKDGTDWEKGMRIWAKSPCVGWRVVNKIEVN